MSAVIDLQSARYRPLVCVAVALETGSPARATLFRLEDVMAFFFYPLKQHLVLIPALCKLDIDLNVLFQYSEEERFETGGAVSRGG